MTILGFLIAFTKYHVRLRGACALSNKNIRCYDDSTAIYVQQTQPDLVADFKLESGNVSRRHSG